MESGCSGARLTAWMMSQSSKYCASCVGEVILMTERIQLLSLSSLATVRFFLEAILNRSGAQSERGPRPHQLEVSWDGKILQVN